MKLTIESTSKMVTLNGIPARIWEGTTEKGVRTVAFITRVTPMDGDATEFERDLLEVQPPSAEAESFPARMLT